MASNSNAPTVRARSNSNDSVKTIKLEKMDDLPDNTDGEDIKEQCDIKTEVNIKEEPERNVNFVIDTKGMKRRRGVRKHNKRKNKRLKMQMQIKKGQENNNGGANNESNCTTPNVDCTGDVEFCLTVKNLPSNWSFMDAKNFVDNLCGPVDEIELIKEKNTNVSALRISYQTEEECKEAMSKFTSAKVEGYNFSVSMTVVYLSDSEETKQSPRSLESKSPQTSENGEKVSEPWKPDLDSWEIDPNGTYGLKESYLKTLGITPPLDKWVFVSNFRCDKSELREALEMAGSVLHCSVFMSADRYANVMYSHPLEAVQAISMLNGQKFYGQPLKVTMQRCPVNTVYLPKGLDTLGMGLGAHGKPLRSIKEHYKRFVNNETSDLNPKAFDLGPQGEDVKEFKNIRATRAVIFERMNTGFAQCSKSNDKTDDKIPLPNSSKCVGQQSNAKEGNYQNSSGRQGSRYFSLEVGPRPGWNGPGPRGPMGPMPGPVKGPVGGHISFNMGGPMPGPMPGPNPGPMPGPMPGAMPGPMQRNMGGHMFGPIQGNMGGPIQGNMGGPMQLGPIHPPMGNQGPMPGPMMQPKSGRMETPHNDGVQLQLSNLPPSTTFNILCEKMSACGHVLAIHLSAPGVAVVRFANKIQADKCFQMYNNFCVEGHTIQVQYI